VVSLILTAGAVLSVIATVCVLRSGAYSTIQKLLQIALVWLLPFVGAIVVLSVWAYDRKFWAHDRKFTSPRPVGPDEGPGLHGIGPESDHDADAGEGGGHGGHGGHGGDSGD
jgi:hypothetical protein